MGTRENENRMDKSKKPENVKIKLSNLPRGITSQDDLRDLCKGFGPIAQVEFYRAQSNQRASGLVTFKSRADADYAIYRLHGSNASQGIAIQAKLASHFNGSTTQAARPNIKRAKKPPSSLVSLTPRPASYNAAPTPTPQPATTQAVSFLFQEANSSEWNKKILSVTETPPFPPYPPPAFPVHPKEHFCASFWHGTLLELIPDLFPLIYIHYLKGTLPSKWFFPFGPTPLYWSCDLGPLFVSIFSLYR